jgi:hypothetical protein
MKGIAGNIRQERAKLGNLLNELNTFDENEPETKARNYLGSIIIRFEA